MALTGTFPVPYGTVGGTVPHRYLPTVGVYGTYNRYRTYQPLVQLVIPLFTQKGYSPQKIVYNFKLTLKFQRCSMLPYFTVDFTTPR